MVSFFLEVATSVIGVLMSLAHFPQAYRIWKRKSSADVSVVMYSIFFVGAYVWLAYGVAMGSAPIIVSYVVAVVSTTITYALLLRYR